MKVDDLMSTDAIEILRKIVDECNDCTHGIRRSFVEILEILADARLLEDEE